MKGGMVMRSEARWNMVWAFGAGMLTSALLIIGGVIWNWAAFAVVVM